MINLEYGHIYITVHYACRHDMLRPVRRDDGLTLSQVSNGELVSPYRCIHCYEETARKHALHDERRREGAQ